MCLSDCCRCDPSWSSCINGIAILDLFVSLVFVTYETSNFGLLTGLIKRKDDNCTDCMTLKDYIPSYWKFDFETFTVMTLIIFISFGFVVEGFLYSKLKSGKRDRVHLFCKKWFEVRLALLVVSILMAVAKGFRGFYTLKFDAVIDAITKTYRVITMFIVKCFMKELEHTVGVIYVKPAKPRKRGSLSLKPSPRRYP